jgi:hypothetical protein
MNKRVLVSLAVVVVSASLVLPKSSLAFWPLDFFNRGQVKGEQTTAGQESIAKKILNKIVSTTSKEKPAEQTEEQKQAALEARLELMVKNGKLTETQKKELLAQLLAIKTKREELRKLEASLAAWLKANKIEPEKPQASPSGVRKVERPTTNTR